MVKKIAVTHTGGIVDGGIALVIVETLSLDANQHSKVVSAYGIYGTVFVVCAVLRCHLGLLMWYRRWVNMVVQE